MANPVIAVHGGAGALARLRDDAAKQSRIRDGLNAALEAGRRVLSIGGSATDAVEQAVCVLESDECFNAGRGSVLNSDGVVEMDAAIMSGEHQAAGAVANLTTIVHPISAARAVMERSPHVLLAGTQADTFAAAAELERAEPSFFVIASRRAQLDRARRADRTALDHDGEGATVGAVALDRHGHLAAATSTGGMTNAAPGRIGDSPIIGAGTWAADGRCAVSATGIGELIMRACIAHEIDARIRFAGAALEEAAQQALALVAELGGQAGCIAVDATGNVALPFSTQAMPRGFASAAGPAYIAIFSDE